ncbi:MAG TPA: DUF5668 domain-containing protein [Terriglobales bacterium]|jgi:hypothetical protein
MKYRYNQYCPCGRCRAHGYMGPAVLITIGVLFLLDQMGHMHWMDFGFTWPALLIVIGLIKLLEHSASIAGHIPREYGANLPPIAGQPVPPVPPVYPPQGPITPQPPIAPAGFISSGSGQDNKGGQNG